MKNFGPLCSCEYCNGSGAYCPECGQPLTASSKHPYCKKHGWVKTVIIDGKEYPADRIFIPGGRRSSWYLLEGEEKAIRFSAKQVDRGDHIDFMKRVTVLAHGWASVHGCYKLQLHQYFVIYI